MNTMNEKCCNLILTSTYNATAARTSIKRPLQSTQSEHATGAIGFGKNSGLQVLVKSNVEQSESK